jgi:subtilase family serine protease
VTASGGTSFFGTFDPGKNVHPTYPAGKEYVWDTLNNCSNSDFIVSGIDISSAYGLCPFGAAGGGNSMLWAGPPWQTGLGTISSASKFGSYCGASRGVECRELPDISLNADPNSGYAEYCADPAAGCALSSPWFQIGGTSCSSPLWSAVVALTDSAEHHRIGLVTPLLYSLDNHSGYSHDLHDMQGGGKFTFDWSSFLGTSLPPVTVFTNSNGYGTPHGFAETTNYDMATGLGTPNVSAIVPALEH